MLKTDYDGLETFPAARSVGTARNPFSAFGAFFVRSVSCREKNAAERGGAKGVDVDAADACVMGTAILSRLMQELLSPSRPLTRLPPWCEFIGANVLVRNTLDLCAGCGTR